MKNLLILKQLMKLYKSRIVNTRTRLSIRRAKRTRKTTFLIRTRRTRTRITRGRERVRRERWEAFQELLLSSEYQGGR